MKRFNHIVKEWLGAERNILWLFVAVMIVPNAFLAYTEPYSITTIVASLMLPAAFYTMWGVLSPRVGVMILCSLPFMVFGAFQLVVLYLFGGSPIAVDMFTNLFTTNASEAGELLSNIYPAVVGVCLLYLPLIGLGIYSLVIRTRLSLSFRKKSLLWAVILLVVGIISTIGSYACRPEFQIKRHIFPINITHNMYLTLQRWSISNNFMKSSEGFSFGSQKEVDSSRREIYVMVIGEASRAHNWQLFGYDRPTNPRLSKVDGLVTFTDMLTQVNATHKTVPIILSPCSAENYDSIYMRKSVITLFKEAGFHTLFISNQVPNRSLIDYFSEEADSRIDISPRQGMLYTQSRYDGDMIEHIKQYIASTPGNLFIVLHTYGSHFNFDKRYPREFAKFTPDIISSVNMANRQTVVNAYDNTILYTDYLLSEVISVLDSTKACTAMLYSSDHGEDLMDDSRRRFLHASPTPTYYQLHIAALAWFSEPYRQYFGNNYRNAGLNSKRPSSTASIFHTMAAIADIDTPYADQSRSLVSDSYHEYPRMYLTDYNESKEFFNTELAEEDFIMFDKMNISYDKSKIRKIIY